MGVLEILGQIGSCVVARNLALTQKLFELPTAHLSKHPGFPKSQDTSPVEGQRQLPPDFTFGFLGREPERVDHISRNFECELRHLGVTSQTHYDSDRQAPAMRARRKPALP